MRRPSVAFYRDWREHDNCLLHFAAGLTLGMVIAAVAAWCW